MVPEYRKKYRYLQAKRVICRREDVRVTVKEFDPERVRLTPKKKIASSQIHFERIKLQMTYR